MLNSCASAGISSVVATRAVVPIWKPNDNGAMRTIQDVLQHRSAVVTQPFHLEIATLLSPVSVFSFVLDEGKLIAEGITGEKSKTSLANSHVPQDAVLKLLGD